MFNPSQGRSSYIRMSLNVHQIAISSNVLSDLKVMLGEVRKLEPHRDMIIILLYLSLYADRFL